MLCLVNLVRLAHGGLEVSGLQVLPVLLKQGDEEVESDDGVLTDLLILHLDVADGAAKAENLLRLELDGGLDVPHNMRRFPGQSADGKKFDAAVLRKYIFGGHIADYMKKLQEEDAEKYKAHFAQYVKAGVKPDGVEAMWTAVHKAIRKDPAFVATKKNNATKPKAFLQKKKNNKQRKNRVKQLIAQAEKAAAQ